MSTARGIASAIVHAIALRPVPIWQLFHSKAADMPSTNSKRRANGCVISRQVDERPVWFMSNGGGSKNMHKQINPTAAVSDRTSFRAQVNRRSANKTGTIRKKK